MSGTWSSIRRSVQLSTAALFPVCKRLSSDICSRAVHVSAFSAVDARQHVTRGSGSSLLCIAMTSSGILQILRLKPHPHIRTLVQSVSCCHQLMLQPNRKLNTLNTRLRTRRNLFSNNSSYQNLDVDTTGIASSDALQSQSRFHNSTQSDVPVEAFEQAISEKNIENAVQFLQALKIHSRYSQAKEGQKSFAVLIGFCRDRESRPCLLVQQRSMSLRREPGFICFPGGHQDDADNQNHVTTALRETEEEIGVDSSRIKVYGKTAPFQTRSDQGMLHPVVGFIDLDFSHGRDPFRLNRSEVQAVHLVALQNLVKIENWRYTRWKPSGLAMPVYRDTVFNDGDVPRIWGLTAMIIHWVMMAAMPDHYHFSFDIMRVPDH